MFDASLIANGQAKNAARVAWACAALDAFTAATHSRAGSFADLSPEDAEEAFTDLLCDLRHVARVRGFDFAALDARAGRNYDHEAAPDYMGD